MVDSKEIKKVGKRSQLYIYHYCLNENLPKEHKDFCGRCWVDECPPSASCGQQNWKYCKHCESKGFKSMNLDNYAEGKALKAKMTAALKEFDSIIGPKWKPIKAEKDIKVKAKMLAAYKTLKAKLIKDYKF